MRVLERGPLRQALHLPPVHRATPHGREQRGAAVIRDPDALRTVWLFGKPYWWARTGGRLILKPATWIKEQPSA
jgi:hypothetical protein